MDAKRVRTGRREWPGECPFVWSWRRIDGAGAAATWNEVTGLEVVPAAAQCVPRPPALPN